MDKIILKGLVFYAYHGVLEEEHKLGQRFFIDLELFCDLEKAGKTDNLNQTINYTEVYQLVKDISVQERYNLIEALAERIAEKILKKIVRVKEVIVRVKKPEAPVEGIFDYVGVEIRRNRNE